MFLAPKVLIIKGLIILNFVLLVLFILLPSNSSSKSPNNEITDITGEEDFGFLKEYFTNLAIEKGAPYAYEVLKQVKVKPGTDMHLMGHVIGEILYQQKGAEGMRYCTQDFRNACSHTIVVGLFTEKGAEAIPEIISACEKAPGGKGAYNMCFHGLGHGVLAFTGYDLEKTADLCSKTKNKSREFQECIGGAIMEIISGGDHDKDLWRKQSEFYLTTNDPLFPCNSEIIPHETKEDCYIYLTPHLFKFAGADLASPTEANFERAFTYCSRIPEDRVAERNACNWGFGKEFVVLAKARDIRLIEEMSEEELLKVYDWCGLADNESGKNLCIHSAISSLFWGGENDVDVSIRFCEVMPNSEENTVCFKQLISEVHRYIDDKDYLGGFCPKIPKGLQNECKNDAV